MHSLPPPEGGMLPACARRLAQRGLRVLVERAVHAREFPQYEAFHPDDENGAPCLFCMRTVCALQ